MKKKQIFILITLFLVFLLPGCDVVELNTRNAPESPPATAMMITIPFDNQHFSVGELVEIKSEVSGAISTPTISLLVDGVMYRTDSFQSAFTEANLYQTWTPANPGTYSLQTSMVSGVGNNVVSNQVTVIVDEALPSETEVVAEGTELDENEECTVPRAAALGYPFCRSGPGTGYGTVTNLEPGQSFPITAMSGSGSWWEIEYSSSGGTCWVWDNLVELCGNLEEVPVIYGKEKEEVVDVEVEEEPEQEQPEKEKPKPPAYSACHDYPDFSTCTSDPEGFGGCSWNTGLNQCEP